MKHKKDKSQNKDWLDWWLSDDAPPPEVESKLQTSSYVPPPEELLPKRELPPEPVATNITVNVNMPKLKKDDLQKLKNRLQQPDVKRAATFAVGMMLLGLSAHSFVFKSPAATPSAQKHQVLSASTTNTTTPAQTANVTPSVSQTPSSQTPTSALSTNSTSTTSNKASFQPVAPASEPELGQYEFARTSYDSSTGIYLYQDTLSGTPITVSQQAIPSSFTSPQDAVDKVAASINATQTFPTDGGTAYMYTNNKTGQQTLVFSLFNILISINSNAPHIASDWQAYISTLH